MCAETKECTKGLITSYEEGRKFHMSKSYGADSRRRIEAQDGIPLWYRDLETQQNIKVIT
jgi:hypothetical protein